MFNALQTVHLMGGIFWVFILLCIGIAMDPFLYAYDKACVVISPRSSVVPQVQCVTVAKVIHFMQSALIVLYMCVFH